MSTALYVLLKFNDETDQQLAEKIHEFKPHISVKDAEKAIDQVKIMMDEVENEFNLQS